MKRQSFSPDQWTGFYMTCKNQVYEGSINIVWVFSPLREKEGRSYHFDLVSLNISEYIWLTNQNA